MCEHIYLKIVQHLVRYSQAGVDVGMWATDAPAVGRRLVLYLLRHRAIPSILNIVFLVHLSVN